LKKIVIILIAIILSGCVTNHYTETDYDLEKRAAAPVLSYIIPGLPQAFNGEWLEAAGYFAGFLVPGLLSDMYTEPDPNNPDQVIIQPEDEDMYNVFMGAAATVLIGSIVDGIITSRERKREYNAFYIAEKEEERAAKLAGDDDRAARLTALYGDDVARRILKGEIWIGMGRDMLIESMGRPDDINTSTGSWGKDEQFCYPGGKYVYVENGEVASWQY